MAEVLNVADRINRGTRTARRERREGRIPAVLYGHGQATVSLTITAEELKTALRHGGRLVELRGAANETALIRELQWDIYGLDVLHVDFARVSADERIEVTVSIELRGECPGVKEGGVLQQPLHEVQIECPAVAIPDKLILRVSNLSLGGELTAGDLALPEGVTLLTAADEVAAQCVVPSEEAESEAPVEGAEPELIGRKAGAEEEEEE